MRRPDRLYIKDILAATDELARFLTGATHEEFLQSVPLQRIAHSNLIIIGEACARLKPATKALAPEVPWEELADLRNLLVHVYFGTDWEIVWQSATERASELRAQLLAAFPDPEQIP